jgi:hypothetical protein
MVVCNNEHFKYPVLSHNDSIRMLTLARSNDDSAIRARLSCVRLLDRPVYSALSYVWGEASPDDPELEVNSQPYKVTRSLHSAISYLASSENVPDLWIDQISINQEDDAEKVQQVQLMSSIFSQARVVIGWLGLSVRSDPLAFDFFRILGSFTNDSVSISEHLEGIDRELPYAQAIRNLADAGLLEDMEHPFHPNSVVGRAAATLCQRQWFRRLWVVQEAALAEVLEIRCGSLTMSSQEFFNGVETLCSTVSDPPMEALHSQYHNAHRLGHLVAKVKSREEQSFPYLAHRFSIWDCTKEQDRLNALYGIVFRHDETTPWFHPSYSVSAPDLYKIFAVSHINLTQRLDILHFAGCVDSDGPDFGNTTGSSCTRDSGDRDKTPSWIPDWRVRLRPLALITMYGEEYRRPPTASLPVADYMIDDVHGELRVRAQLVDRIHACGLPYCDSVCTSFGINVYEIFWNWYELASAVIGRKDTAQRFASTLTMGCRLGGVEREFLKISANDLTTLFDHWVARNGPNIDENDKDDSTAGLEESTRFGNLAEELCRNRTFFVTEAGYLGLGNVGVQRGNLIYLTQGLGSPIIVDAGGEQNIFRGTCYIHGLIDTDLLPSGASEYVSLA